MRVQAHDKKKVVDAQMQVVKEEVAELSQAARAFVAQFNPKWLIDREGSAGTNVRFTPKAMVQRLKQVPEKSSELVPHTHHSLTHSAFPSV